MGLGGGFRDEFPPDLERPLPPVAIAHGRADENVPVTAIRRVRDVLERPGGAVTYLETDAGHEIDGSVIPHLRAFLSSLP